MTEDDQRSPNTTASVEDLVGRLGHGDLNVRADAVRAVARLSFEDAATGAPVLIPPLVKALRWGRTIGDEVFTKGMEAIDGMGMRAVSPLVGLLDDDNYMTVQVAATALARCGDPEMRLRGRAILFNFIFPDPPTSFDEYKGQNAVRAVAAVGDQEVIDFLADMVVGRHPDGNIRTLAGLALKRFGHPSHTLSQRTPSVPDGFKPRDPLAGGEKPWWKFW